MLRSQITDALKTAMLAKESATVSSIRMITAALKDKDIAARPKGQADGIGEDEILALLQSMIKQRRESIALYVQGNRQDLADKELLAHANGRSRHGQSHCRRHCGSGGGQHQRHGQSHGDLKRTLYRPTRFWPRRSLG